MVIKTKDELKNSLDTGQTPTGETFANLIDSAILTVNGQKPSTAGDVVINVPDLNPLQTQITSHVALQAGEEALGHVQIQNYVGPNPTRAITANAVKNLQDTLVAEDTRIEGLVTSLQTLVNTLQSNYTTLEARVAALETPTT